MPRRDAGREVVIEVAEGDVVTASSGSSVALGSPAGEAMTATGPERPARGLGLDAAGAREAHHRARTLGDPTARWRHLR